ncbi:conserved hypothetical protein [Agrobacterium fabacearum CFBP 5771]|nr:conserved hypothetical protein [Agrobacterium fabacearum CFBP 5771]
MNAPGHLVGPAKPCLVCCAASAGDQPIFVRTSAELEWHRQISATDTPSSPCFRMNVFCASENCDAFIVFRSFPSQENAPEHSNQKRFSMKGSDQQSAVSVSRGPGGEGPKAVPLAIIDANRAKRQRPLSYHATCLADTIIISI